MATLNYYSANGQVLGEAPPRSAVRRYGPDALGSVASTFSPSDGALENSYRFKPYGTPLVKIGEVADPRFTWIGARGHRQTGAAWSEVYVRARNYSHGVGRWTTLDPAGLHAVVRRFPPSLSRIGGDYAYAESAPTHRTDPSGLAVDSIADCAFDILSGAIRGTAEQEMDACMNCVEAGLQAGFGALGGLLFGPPGIVGGLVAAHICAGCTGGDAARRICNCLVRHSGCGPRASHRITASPSGVLAQRRGAAELRR